MSILLFGEVYGDGLACQWHVNSMVLLATASQKQFFFLALPVAL